MSNYWSEPVLDTTEVKRQHSVPRLLLRQFCVDGALDVHELETGRTFSTSPEQVGVERGYYNVDIARQVLSAESWLSEVEGKASQVLSRIIADPESFASLSSDEENDWARFVCAQNVRTEAFREMDERMRQQLIARLKKAGRNWLYNQETLEDADQIWNAWKDKPDEWFLNETGVYQPTETVASMLAGVQGFANILVAMPWRLGSVLVPPGVYVGDNPVVRRELTSVPFANYAEYTYYLPLSRSLVFSAGPHLSGSPKGPRRVIEFSAWETSVVRHLTTRNASRHLFGAGPYVPPACAQSCLDRITQEDWRLTVKTRRPPSIFAR